MKTLVLISVFITQATIAKLPTDAELARIQKVMASLAQIQLFTKRIGNPRRPVPQFVSVGQEVVDELLKAANQPDCKVVVEKPEPTPNSGGTGVDIRNSRIEVVGEKCAFSLLADVQSKKDAEGQVTFTITFLYESRSPELKKLIDVEKFEIVGPGKVNILKMNGGMGGEISMGFAGKIHSQTEGQIDYQMKMEQVFKILVANGNMTISSKMSTPMDLKFRDFAVATLAEVELENGQGSEKHMVNGENVTKAYYEQVTKNFSVPGAKPDEE